MSSIASGPDPKKILFGNVVQAQPLQPSTHAVTAAPATTDSVQVGFGRILPAFGAKSPAKASAIFDNAPQFSGSKAEAVGRKAGPFDEHALSRYKI